MPAPHKTEWGDEEVGLSLLLEKNGHLSTRLRYHLAVTEKGQIWVLGTQDKACITF
jgi:hypothetical protein